VLYGLSASLCKPTVEILGDDGIGAVLTSWRRTRSRSPGSSRSSSRQVSLATWKLAASVAAVSVCNPLVSIVIGTLLLDERLAEPMWHKVVAYCGLGVALFGAVDHLTRNGKGEKEKSTSGAPSPAPAT
jgi:hypothetical protein